MKLLFISIMFLFIVSCDNREFNNLVDSDFPIDVPRELNAELISVSQIRLHWNDSDVSTAVQIEKQEATDAWYILDVLELNNREYLVNEVNWDNEVRYRILFKADENQS